MGDVEAYHSVFFILLPLSRAGKISL